MSEIERSEALKRFNDNMQRAISRAKELAIALKQPLYNNWADSLDRMRVQGVYMGDSKSRTKGQIESDINLYSDRMQ